MLIYAGTADSENPDTKNTILYGDENNRVLIIYRKDEKINVTIKGLKIQAGTAHDEVADLTLNSGETTKYRGGGIFNANADTKLHEVVITGNVANNESDTDVAMGGGIYNHSGDLTLNNCYVESNVSTKKDNEGKGGGIYLDEGTAKVVIEKSAVSQNTATTGNGLGSGGGIYINKGEADVTISDASITNNIAIDNESNASNAQGGGIYCEQRNIDIKNTRITQNIATIGSGSGLGGGIYNMALSEEQHKLTLDNSVISENTAFKNTNFAPSGSPVKGFGGGIYIENGSVAITESDLQKNVAADANATETVGGNGGAIHNVAGRLIIEACQILENTATNANGFGYGGGISNVSDKEVKLFNTLIARNIAGDQALGGGISNTTGSNVTLINVTITENSAGQQGSIGGGSGIYNFNSGHITVENTIVWYNKEDNDIVQYLDDGATHISGYCFISGLKNDPGMGDTTILDGKDRPADYPKFVDLENHNYRLKAASPLRNLAHKQYIDNGASIWNNPDEDLDNNRRVKRELDLGAYESNPFTVTLTDFEEFNYNVPDSLEKYGVISPIVYEVDPDSSFKFALRVDSNTIYKTVVEVDGQEYQADEAKIYTIPDISKDIHINVQLTVEKYAVTMPAVKGVITDSVAGTYHVAPNEEFVFSLKPKDGYNSSGLIVKANNKVITPDSDKYRITVSSNVAITIEGLKTNEYTVRMPKVTGISTTPSAGNYTTQYDSTFNFTATKASGYENYNLSIKTDQNYPIETVDAATGKYRIKNIKHDVTLALTLTRQPEYTVTLNAISEIETSPKAGQYTIEEGNSFKVTFVIPEKYQADDILVELDGNAKTFSRVKDNTYAYTITDLQKNHTISIVKNPRYQINLNKIDGIIFNPVSGTHYVGKYDNFNFTITLDKNYAQSTFKIYANNLQINPIRISNGVYAYSLPSVQNDYNITQEGVKQNNDTGNEDINGKIKVYIDNKTLFIRTGENALLAIYTLSGQMHKLENITAGTTSVQLPSGVYIVKVNDEIFKVIL